MVVITNTNINKLEIILGEVEFGTPLFPLRNHFNYYLFENEFNFNTIKSSVIVSTQ